ncbi:MAG: hypothetical protein ABFS16_10730 [Bacteroidota bacterium]
MKKLTLSVAFIMMLQLTFAGGLLTNYNQSAQYIRMMSRNASLEIDAVFYNPAGLVKLENGWHFGVYNQTIFQEKTVNSGFPLLNDGEYIGEVKAPVFPSAYGVYKKDKWAFSLGFGPVGGGGSAEFERGLPSFEIPITKVVPGLAGLSQIDPSLSVTGYDADLYFKGSSVFWGIQVGATYAINDVISVYGGARILPSKNAYQGYIRNVQLKVAGQSYPAPGWLSQTAGVVNNIASQANAGANTMYDAANMMQPVIDNNLGGLTLAELEANSVISPEIRAQVEGGLQLMGIPPEQIGVMNVTQIQGAYNAAGDQLTATAGTLSTTGATLGATSSQLEDREVDTEQTGTGITPILAINISPNDDWNIAVKYEHKTYMDLTNSTTVDDLGLFPDGGKSNSDMPGNLAIGVGYRGLDWLEAQLSYNTYFDKRVNWGGNVRYNAVGESVQRQIDNNYYEVALGLQFNLADNFALSVGGLRSKTGVAENWQSDFSYSNSSVTLGGGIMWKITDRLTLDAGVSNTFYEEDEVNFTDPDVGAYTDLYNKSTISFAAGISYSIF